VDITGQAPARHGVDNAPYGSHLSDQPRVALYERRRYNAILDAQINDAQQRLEQVGRGPDLVSFPRALPCSHPRLTQW
jgi:hypothetical protein